MFSTLLGPNSKGTKVGSKDWLLVVDYQNDFLPPDGALAVPGGGQLVEKINKLIEQFPRSLATRDWHPEDHYSFEGNGGSWPPHCLQDSWGARFHPDLTVDELDMTLKKGTDPEDRTDYSGFSGKTREGKSLKEVLTKAGAERVFLAGVALDYCVRATALDALKEGYKTFLLEDCTEPVDEQAGSQALKEIREAGGEVVKSFQLEFPD